jgi:hypothetical protein
VRLELEALAQRPFWISPPQRLNCASKLTSSITTSWTDLLKCCSLVVPVGK